MHTAQSPALKNNSIELLYESYTIILAHLISNMALPNKVVYDYYFMPQQQTHQWNVVSDM